MSPTCTWNKNVCQSKCIKYKSQDECTKNKCDWWETTGCDEKTEQLYK